MGIETISEVKPPHSCSGSTPSIYVSILRKYQKGVPFFFRERIPLPLQGYPLLIVGVDTLFFLRERIPLHLQGYPLLIVGPTIRKKRGRGVVWWA
jgi:hypothetical protein